MRRLNHDHEGDKAMSPHDHHGHALAGRDLGDSFSRDTSGLPNATSPEIINLRDQDVFELRALPVRKRIGDTMIRMLGYNGSIPGPTLHVDQGSEVTVDFTNETDLETTVHWHGLRVDNRFDGVPEGAHHGMQPPIAPGVGSATGCASPTRASTGTTHISGRTTHRRWVSTGISSSCPFWETNGVFLGI